MINRLVTLSIVLYPILINYKSPIPRLDLMMFFSLIFCFFLFIGKPKLKVNIPLLILVIQSILIVVINAFLSNLDFRYIYIFRILNLLIQIFIYLFYLYPNYFDIDYAEKVFNVVSVASIVYLFVQIIFYNIFDLRLISYIPQLAFDSEAYASLGKVAIASTESVVEGNYYRATSFFFEPAHFSEYIIFYLVYQLFKKRNLKMALVSTTALLLSGSGIGIAFAIMNWTIYIFKEIFCGKNIKTIYYILIFIFLLLAFFNTSFFENMFINRVFKTDVFGYNAISGRTDGYLYFFKSDIVHILFGNGYGIESGKNYFSGFSSILFYTGLIGMIVYFVFIILYYKRIRAMHNKVSVINYFVLNIFAGVFWTNLIFYIPILSMIGGNIDVKAGSKRNKRKRINDLRLH